MTESEKKADISQSIRENIRKMTNLAGLVTSYGLQITAAAVAILAVFQGAASPDAAMAALVAMLGQDVVKKRFEDMVDRLRGKKEITAEEIAQRVAAAVREDGADLRAMLGQTQAAVLLLQEAVAQSRTDVLEAVLNSRDAILAAIWESHADLRRLIEGLVAPSPTLHTLGAPVADFTGRKADIAELTDALKPDGRCDLALISGLRGMGGIGKTELARMVGHLLASDYPDAQLEIALQAGDAPKTPEQVLGEVVRAFAPAAKLPDSVGELQALCRQVMTGKRGFLLLDNAADAAQVRPLLPPPAGWAVVVTSRRRFALPGACLDKNLDVLSPEDARELIGRILKAGGRAVPDEEVARIADLCGRLPLALRIAASFLVQNRTWSVKEYIAALEAERLERLDVEGEGSVRASLGVSVRQLEEQSPKLAERWRLLGVFPAPFEREAAAAVWELPGDETRDVLTELYRWSLVEYNEKEGTYVLHDLLREYALAEAPEGLDGARRRHAAYYLAAGAAADDLYETDALAGLRRFDAALPHLRAAWAWMRAQGDADAARWLSDFAGRIVDVLNLRMTPRERIPVLEAALEAARRLRDRKAEGIHLGNLGLAYFALGDPRRAVGFYEQQLAIVREIGDRRGEGNALGNLGNAYLALGDPRRAIGFYEQHLAIAREIGDRRGEGNALGNLGLAYADLGDPRRAIGFYEQRLAIAREIGDRRGEGNALGNLGIAYRHLGDPRRAIGFYEQTLQIHREIGDRRGEGNALGNLGLAYADLGDPRRATGFYEQHLAIAREIGDRRGEGNALGNLGLAYAALGDPRRAIEYHEKALAISREIGDRRAEGSILGNLGLAYAALGDPRRAIGFYEQALAIDREIGDRRGEGNALGNLGSAYADLGDPRRAIGFYEQQLAIAREIGDRQGEANACWNMGLAYEKLGDYARAADLMQVCVDYERAIGHPDAEKDAAYLAEVRAKAGR